MREISLSMAWIPIAAYLIGSIPFGILLAEMFGGGGGCGPFFDLPLGGPPPGTAANRHVRRVCSGDARRLQTRGEHSTTRGRARASIFIRQEQGRRVTRIAILGAGIWGTALALMLSRSPRAHEISLWVRDAALADEIRRKRENIGYLPGRVLPEHIHVTHNLEEAL